jgi:hypothetical protein
MQQGYAGEGEITILTPYVGQLLRLRQAVQERGHMKLIISDRDQEELKEALGGAEDIMGGATANLELEGEDEEGEGGGGGGEGMATGSSSGGIGSGGAGRGTSVATAAGGSGGTRIVEFKSSLRIATIDNFQVRLSSGFRVQALGFRFEVQVYDVFSMTLVTQAKDINMKGSGLMLEQLLGKED